MKAKLTFQPQLFDFFSFLHDPSEIIRICWFGSLETFLIVINAENSCADSYFCGNNSIYLKSSVTLRMYLL